MWFSALSLGASQFGRRGKTSSQITVQSSLWWELTWSVCRGKNHFLVQETGNISWRSVLWERPWRQCTILIDHKYGISMAQRKEISDNANWMINSIVMLQYGWCQAQISLEYQNHRVFMGTFYESPIWPLLELLSITALGATVSSLEVS